ncbi:hypothetical protein [Mucisphaera calidilacus]|uniref:PEP-CTERM protein-sorting domain-containing protein n=1 Tax=Mucisphaera calidilacus TaxID=2527982 RepID=A0A518BTL5_9BACT|nr:hypothetical protein [Mucisphaera calidilacus]QDU70320.1 hypothetical protein Pan265_01430 [Mucisphaera calidilacus]
MKKILTASAIAAAAFAGSTTAQADSVQSVMLDLANSVNLAGVPAEYTFNDLSLSTSLGAAVPVAGDTIEGVFTIESIQVAEIGDPPAASITLADTDVEVFGRFTLTVLDVVGPVTNMSIADFEIFEDDRADGIRDTSLVASGTAAYNSTAWGGGAGITDGSLFAELDIVAGGFYQLIAGPVSSSIQAALDVTGGPLLTSPDFITVPPVIGTGSVTATTTPGEFEDQAQFVVTTTVLPTPTAALGGLMLVGLAAARRRRIA